MAVKPWRVLLRPHLLDTFLDYWFASVKLLAALALCNYFHDSSCVLVSKGIERISDIRRDAICARGSVGRLRSSEVATLYVNNGAVFSLGSRCKALLCSQKE